MSQENPLVLHEVGSATWLQRAAALAGLALHQEDLIHARHRRPALDTQPQKDWLGPCGRLKKYKNKGGVESASYWWPAGNSSSSNGGGKTVKQQQQQKQEKPRGVVVLLHDDKGFTCFDFLKRQDGGGRPVYEGSLVAQLNAAGFSVVGLDARGLGRSQGLFGTCMDFQGVYVSDLQELLQRLRASTDPSFQGLPVFLLGAGLGGLTALHTALQQQDGFAGVVLLSPLLSMQRTAGSWMGRGWRLLLPLLDHIWPTLPLGVSVHGSKQPELVQDMYAEPAVYHYPTRVRNYLQYTAAAAAALAAAGAVRLPLLVYHGEQDQTADVQGSQQLVAAAKSPDKELRILKGAGHFIWREQCNQAVFTDIIAWLKAHGGADARVTLELWLPC